MSSRSPWRGGQPPSATAQPSEDHGDVSNIPSESLTGTGSPSVRELSSSMIGRWRALGAIQAKHAEVPGVLIVLASANQGVPEDAHRGRHRAGRSRSGPSTCLPTSTGPGSATASPIEANNGHLEHLRGSALSHPNLTNYIARSLLETGRFRSRLHTRFCSSLCARSR